MLLRFFSFQSLSASYFTSPVYKSEVNDAITSKMYSNYMHRVTKKIKSHVYNVFPVLLYALEPSSTPTVCYRSYDSNKRNRRILMVSELNLNKFMPYAFVIMSMVYANINLTGHIRIVSPTRVC